MMKDEVAGKSLLFNIIALPVLALAAPAAKLWAYNHAYFDISAVEAAAAVLSVSMFAIVPLALLSVFKPFRMIICRFAAFILIVSVSSTFLLPVGLSAIDGGGGALFEPRREAFFFLLGAMTAAALFVLVVNLFPRIRNKALRLFDGLTLAAIIYAVVFTLYAVISTPTGFSMTGDGGTDAGIAAPVSPDKNIFIISFEQIQGNFMAAYLQHHPEKKSIFEGFEFYPDAAVTYPNTDYSISSTLLGRIAADASEDRTYALNAPGTILAAAEKRGFQVYTNKNMKSDVYNCVNCTDDPAFNFIKTYELIRHAVNLAFGADIAALGLTLPKSVAGFAGPDLVHHSWMIDLHEFENITQRLTVESGKSVIYLMHVYGTHQPFIYNADCTLKTPDEIAASQNIDGAVDEVSCFMNLIESFFSRLKEHAVYDNSMIFVVSDHGYEKNTNDLYYTDEKGRKYLCRAGAAIGDSSNIKPAGSYNPIFFFKDFNARKDLSADPSPVSLIDIAPTICESAGCGKDWDGISLRGDIPPDRKRLFWQYFGGSGSDRRDADGTDRLHDGLDTWWRVNSFRGPVYPNLAFAMGLSKSTYYRHYTPGERIGFGAGGTGPMYTTRGWSFTEKDHRWTTGNRAEMEFRIQDENPGDMVLRLKAWAYRGGGRLGHQEIGVLVNGREVADWQMAGLDWYEAKIPADVVEADDSLSLAFTISHPTSPREAGESEDPRKLGIAVQELQIVKKDADR